MSHLYALRYHACAISELFRISSMVSSVYISLVRKVFKMPTLDCRIPNAEVLLLKYLQLFIYLNSMFEVTGHKGSYWERPWINGIQAKQDNLQIFRNKRTCQLPITIVLINVSWYLPLIFQDWLFISYIPQYHVVSVHVYTCTWMFTQIIYKCRYVRSSILFCKYRSTSLDIGTGIMSD